MSIVLRVVLSGAPFLYVMIVGRAVQADDEAETLTSSLSNTALMVELLPIPYSPGNATSKSSPCGTILALRSARSRFATSASSEL